MTAEIRRRVNLGNMGMRFRQIPGGGNLLRSQGVDGADSSGQRPRIEIAVHPEPCSVTVRHPQCVRLMIAQSRCRRLSRRVV